MQMKTQSNAKRGSAGDSYTESVNALRRRIAKALLKPSMPTDQNDP